MDQDLSLTRASRPGSGAATGIGLVLVLLLSLVVPVVQARAADPGLYDQVRSDYEAITYDDLASILDIRIRSLDKNAARTALKERLGREATEQEVEQSLWPRYMDQLAMRKDFEALKADLGTRMRELISKDQFVTADILRRDAKKILFALTYLDHYYSAEVGGRKLKDLILFEPQEAFGAQNGTPVVRLQRLAQIKHFGAQPSQASRIFSNAVDPRGRSVTTWLSEMVSRYEPSVSPSSWFRSRTKAVIHEGGSTTLYEQMENDERLRSHLLPLLALSSPSVYALSVDHSVTYGLTSGYGGADNPALKSALSRYARNQQSFVEMWKRVSATPEGFGEGPVVVVRDGMFKAPRSAGLLPAARWSPQHGPDADPGVLEFFGPLGLWGSYQFIGGQASPIDRRIDLVLYEALSDNGVTTFTHEMTHIFDEKVWFNGHKRREGVKIEAYARGFFESMDNTQATEAGASEYAPFFNLNTAFELGQGRVQNASPSRFQSSADLGQYMRGLMDVIYSLEVLEAEATLALTPQEKAVAFSKVTQVPDPDESGTPGTTDSFTHIDLEEATSLRTVNDLVDHGIVAGRLSAKGKASTALTVKSNDYVVVPLYEPVYAGLQNDAQAVGDFLFRRYAHEMLGEYGWERGMVAYASDQYPNDAVALAAIMPEHGGSMAAFKKAVYAQRGARLSDLKAVAGFADVEEIRAAMATAVKADVTRLAQNRANGVTVETEGVTAVNTLKHKIFRGYLLDTDDFRSSIYREPTARELWVRNGSESDGSGAGTYEQPYQNIATAMRNARPGDVVKLKEDVTVNGTAASVLLDKAVTLDGTGHTLVLRGQDIEVAADVTIRDMNLVMLQESSASGTIYAGGHKLVLDKVTTRVSQSQTGQRPVIVTGTKGDRAPGPKAEVVVRNATDQTRFKSIIVGDLDTASSTPASIVLDSRLIRVEDGVFLSPPNGPVRNGAVDLVSKSDFVNIVRNPAGSTKTGDSSVTFDGASLSGVVMDEVNNLTLANKARVTLADGSKDLLISDVLNLQDQTVLDVAETITSVRESTGSGLVRIGDQGAFLSGATSETISYEVYKGDWDYSEYLGKAYVSTNDPALEPEVRLLPAGSPYRLVKDDRGAWRLQAVDTTAKVAPVAAVTLSEAGRPKTLTAGEFAVTVTPHPDNDTAVEVTGLPSGEVPVGDDGSADLGRWSIGAEGVYRFTVRQVDKGAAGVTYDQEPVEVTVTVEQNPDFPTRLGLVATTTFRKAGAVVQGISFANTFTAPAQDADGDGVVDSVDACEGTPVGAQVGVDGCSVAPSLGVVPGVVGVKGKALAAVSVPVSNPGAAKGLRCVAQGLPAGLVVALSTGGDACVISGTPEVDTRKDQAFTVSLFYTPVDGGRPEASVSGPGVVSVRLPAFNIGGSILQDDDGDGVADVSDRCEGTPSGVRVGADGCALAPVLGAVPELTGVKGKALAAVSVPVSNPGAAKGLRCVAQGLPAGLVVALAPSGDACVISGTPEVDTSKDQAFTVSLFYTPVDGKRPEASISAQGKANITLPALSLGPSTKQDDDADGVLDEADKCAGTPAGAQVGVDGCSVAPSLGVVPGVVGVKGKALAAVSVPVSNPGAAKGLRCQAQGLPAGLVVALSTGGDACVISGTPEVDTRKDQAFTVSLFYTPVDGGRPEASISAQGKANITLPALSLGPGQKASPSPTPTAQSQATASAKPSAQASSAPTPQASTKPTPQASTKPTALATAKPTAQASETSTPQAKETPTPQASASAEPTATSTATPLPQQQVKEQGKGLARTGTDAFQLLILLAGLLVSGGVLVAYRRQRG
ncbi:ZmpA/ZmpB/ZmpC family metallo-endopeptidase [Actinomyces weissii]|uniref:Peptidase M26 n=1 Tax=Actinomyces weissii TaxID=675090 RepID=A0A7T7S1Y5_9ACTO|nr:ZmpA/ZmpB/ZmpC family metallo-endopeptidase [Actinomyces weissii]QQM66884.1 hypothetical protein JG540_07405 [Actinomyces weissii]